MAKKKQRIRRARLAVSTRCSHIVSYTYYPERGVKTERHGRCGGWSIFDCGLCRRHCRKKCVKHKIMWKLAA